MADREGAEKACSNPNPVVDGRRANVNLAYLGARPKHGQPGKGEREREREREREVVASDLLE